MSYTDYIRESQNFNTFLPILESKDFDIMWDLVTGEVIDNRIPKDIRWWQKVLPKITHLISKFNPSLKLKSTRLIATVLLSLFTIQQVQELFGEPNIETSVKKNITHEISLLLNQKMYNPLNLSISKEGIEDIKSEETLKLRAYSIGDGKITIGYGHAEPKNHSKFRIGQKITKEQADILLNKDIKLIEKYVKNIFKQWKEKDIHIYLTQDMYDAIISLAYNIGPTKLRTTEFIQHLKKGDYETAGETIKKTSISTKFPGLKLRRERESEKFLSFKNI